MAKKAHPRRQTASRHASRDWRDLLLLAILSVCIIVVAAGSLLLWRASRATATAEPAAAATPRPEAASSAPLSAEAAPAGNVTAPGQENTGPSSPESAEGLELGRLEGTAASAKSGLVWAACEKAVFYWTLAPGQNGEASMTLRLQKAGQAASVTLVDEFATALTQPLSGAALQPLSGGEYTLSAEGVYSPWSVRVVCQDGAQPLSEAPDLAGSISTVTPSFDLPACNQLALLWSVEPDSSGRASIIVRMYIVGRAWPDVRVNETATDAAEPLSGIALFSVESAEYFVVVDRVSGPWTIHWECRG